MQMIVDVDAKQVQANLAKLASAVSDLTPAMRVEGRQRFPSRMRGYFICMVVSFDLNGFNMQVAPAKTSDPTRNDSTMAV